MIASFAHKFIFVKTRKTGGTSVEIVLSTWLADGDVCTPISDYDEALRQRYGGKEPQRSHEGKKIYNHMPAREIAEVFPDLWQDSYRFSVERHPYEKAVSLAYHSSTVRSEVFETALDRVIGAAEYIDRDIYRIQGKISVDEVILYDRLWERLTQVAAQMGQVIPDELPRAKSSYRRSKTPAREILSETQKARIQFDAALEFDSFGFDV